MESISDMAGSAADLKIRRRVKASTSQDNLLRLPPNSPESEQAVLGCCLISPNDCVPEVISKIGEMEVFYDLRHQTIFDAMVSMSNLNQPIDLITLQQWLKDDQMLEQVGGIAYLSSLQDAVPSAANLSYYLDIAREKYLLRKMISVCTEIVGRVYDYQGEVQQLLDEVERDILAIRPLSESTATPPIAELVDHAMNRIEDSFNRNNSITGIATGFPDLDKLTSGLHNGNMIVIAARPSMGKTSLGMNICEHIVLELKQPAGFFSLEMTADELVLRSLCSCARVNLRSINEGFMSERDFPRLTSAAGLMRTSKIYIDDTGGLTIMQFRARARRMVQMFGVKVIIADYLQLFRSPTKRGNENRQQEVSDISAAIKALAKELRIPIIVLCQLNRDIEKGSWRKPKLSDIRESGSIEQDGDVIGFLYKLKEDESGDTFQDDHDGVPTNLLIAKQRNGPTGEVNLTFLKSYTRFESAAKISDFDCP